MKKKNQIKSARNKEDEDKEEEEKNRQLEW